MRDEIAAFKRERILQEAVRLFYARGFTATTLDEVAAGLGVTKPFIYSHFRSKADLLRAICQPTIAMSVEAAERALAAPGTPTERLHGFVGDFTRVVLGRQANIAVFFREEKHLAPEALAEINALRKEFDRLLVALLDAGVAAGEFRIADTHVTALAIGGMVSWAYTWYRPDGRLSLDELGARMAQVALQMAGVLPPGQAARRSA
jgi:AcrR family transcriptional regulator